MILKSTKKTKVFSSVRGVQISKEGAKPTTWEDIFPEESINNSTTDSKNSD